MKKSELRKLIREEIRKIIKEVTLRSEDFDTSKYYVIDVYKEGNSWVVTYDVNIKKIKGSQDFHNCEAFEKYGYEPTNVSKDGNNVEVVFEKY